MISDAKRTHAVLLKAARQVLGSASINNMTMHAIIDASGVSKAQSYRHFRTPSDVVAALAAELLRDITKNWWLARKNSKKPQLPLMPEQQSKS